MKSKIQTNQILKKGMSVLLLLMMLFSTFSVTSVSFAAVAEDGTLIEEEDVEFKTEEQLEDIHTSIEDLKEQLENFKSSENTYDNFVSYINECKKLKKEIEITNEFQLRALSLYVASGNNCSGLVFVIKNNISLDTSHEWEPIGNSGTNFRGTLDGRGHTISGMVLTKKRSNVGLVGYLGAGGTVKNIVIGSSGTIINLDPDIDGEVNDLISSTDSKYKNLGAVVGYAKNATIINCKNKANISGGTNVGGIVGGLKDKSTISDCINEGTVLGYSRVGGVFGVASYTSKVDTTDPLRISRCINKGNVYGIFIDIGGITGNTSGNIVVDSCLNQGTIAATKYELGVTILGVNTTLKPQNIGGIIGATGGNGVVPYVKNKGTYTTVDIKKCINGESGKVYGYMDVGGLVGQFGNSNYGYSKLADSINYCSSISSGYKNSDGQTTLMGGVVGTIGSAAVSATVATIDGCYYMTNLSLDDYNKLDSTGRGTLKTVDILNKKIGNIGAYGNKLTKDNSDCINNSFRIVKNKKENNAYEYYYEGRAYKAYDETNKKRSQAYRALYLKEAETGVWSGVYNNGTLTGADSPVKGDKSGKFTPSSKVADATYQPWLVRLNKLTYKAETAKLVVDYAGPVAKSVEFTTKDKNDIAIEGDTIVFKVAFDENITVSKTPILSFQLKYYDTVANKYQYIDRTTKNFVGVEGKYAIFEYKVTDDDVGSADEKTENRTIVNLKVSSGLIDTFGNISADNNITNLIQDNFIILKKDFNKSKYYTCKEEGRIGSVGYRFQGAEVHFDGIKAYMQDGFIVKVSINRVISEDDAKKIKLNIKLSDRVITIDTPSKVNVKEKGVELFYTNISTERVNYRIVEEVYLTTSEAITVSSKSLKLERANTFATTNSGEEDLYIDNTAPAIKMEKTDKNTYSLGEIIALRMIISDRYTLKEISESTLPKLMMKFGDGEAKEVKPTSIKETEVKDCARAVEILYEYKVQQGDQGALKLYYAENNGVKSVYDVAENALDLVSKTFSINKSVDTSTPVVLITAKKVEGTKKTDIENNITNADTLEYTFTWSEKVEGFTAEDITVINGTKGELSNAISNENGTYSYTMNITPNVQKGNVGDLKVIVEQNVCQDAVTLGNIRAENIITIDKDAPTLNNYKVSINDSKNKITVETIFDESIAVASKENLSIKIGNKKAVGTLENAIISGDKVTYVYNVSGADGGNVDITLVGKVKDVAGNESEQLNAKLENQIVLEKHVIIVVDADGKEVEYSFSKNDIVIADFSKPTYFKAGDKITVTKTAISENSTSSSYEYIINEKCDLTHMKYMDIDEASEEVTFSGGNGNINISEANIYFDTMYPIVETEIYAEEKRPSGIYKENDKIIIKVNTSEIISKESEFPNIQVNFSNSGKGKYNYESENNTGFAEFKKEELNQNGSTTLYYEYIIQEGDDGEISISFESGRIEDLAGNVSIIKELYTPNKPTTVYSEKNDFGININKVEFFADRNCTQEIKGIEGTKQNGDIYIKVTFEDGLYTDINTSINTTNGPIMKLNGEIETDLIKVSGNGSELVYKYDKDESLYLTSIEYITLINDSDTTIYPGKDAISNGKAINSNAKYNYDIPDFEVDPRDLGNSTIIDSVIADTLAPTVVITAANGENVINNSLTNADEITYTFDWSEEVSGFGIEDITVNGGNIKSETTLTQDSEDKTKYTLVVNTNVSEGNLGNIQVIVEQNACQDIAGHSNIRTENILGIDKQSPILMGLEASAKTAITLNQNVDTVKEYYKAGDEVIVVALFNETIEESVAPVLALQFSESGNAKGTISEGIKSGNKITYTYTITNGDTGVLSVKGFTGEVEDSAGNTTKVTKRVLNGDTIKADTRIPELKELKVINPSEGTYKEGNTIVIEAIYDEPIYSLINNEVNNFVDSNVPTLKLKFGNGEEKEATSKGYVSNEDKTKLVYNYTIANGDNGELIITSYSNKENVKVVDIAGNEAVLGVNQTGNEITADTTRPEVTNITALVEDPTISNTEIYYKEGNTVKIILTFSEKVSSNVIMPQILIGFSEDESVEPTEYSTYAYESNWNVNSTTVEYSYRIKEGDNGYLWVKVPENQFADKAGNGNVEKLGTKITNIFADTAVPTLEIYKDIETIQEGQKITVKATLSEDVYNLVENRRTTLTKQDAPKMIYGFGENGNLEASAYSVDGNVITYVITKENTISGEFYHAYFKGNVYDRAGNPCWKNNLDTIAPVLESIEIIPNAGKYAPYCKVGTKIYVIATFNELIEAENIKIKAKIGEVEIAELLDGEIVEENNTKVKFTYTVKAGDMGKFEIVDICGNIEDTTKGEDPTNTYGWVEDKYENRKKIYGLEDEGVTVTGEAEADTKDPYITSIKAIADEKEVATYTKEEGKDAVVTVGRTKANIVEYIVTYSEKVPYDHFDKISITNGIIKSIVYTDSSKNEYKITVQTTVEGVQSLMIKEGTVEDKAGNIDGFVRLDAVTVDFTKPTVRFISEYNGGVYVLPTNINKVEIRPNVEISEDIAKIEYKWNDEKDYVEIENYSSSSDIAVPTKAFTEAGTYKLYIKVEDLAGNVSETSKTYQVTNSYIDITLSTEEYTNQDVIATVEFDNELTDNRKVLFRAECSEDVIQLDAKGTNQEGGIEYNIRENGTIYVEATDRLGNKVFTERTITNIDKEAPIVELSLNGADLVIGTGKDKATIKSEVKVNDKNSVEIKYIYSNNETLSDEEKGEMQALNNYEEAIKADAVSGTYYLHVIAKDAAGNEKVVKSNDFKVLDTNVREKEIITEGENGEEVVTKETIPADIEISKLIDFKQEGKHISISYNNFGEGEEYLNIIKDADISLTQERDGYIDYEYKSYVEVNGATTIEVVGTDACGNQVTATYEVTKDSIEGPEFEVVGNPENWTNQDVKLEVSCYEKLSALTVNGTDILSQDAKVRSHKIVNENGDYEFVATDTYGNVSKKIVKVTKIDKVAPVITKAEVTRENITITATDELSGVIQYAISTTSEVPAEWSDSNVIKTTEDGIFYVWAIDKAGNITRSENSVRIDTTAPTVTFNYLSQTVTVGMPLETNIITDEEAIISYSWDNENWVDSENLISTLTVSKKSTTPGKNTLYVKAKDSVGNESKIQTLEFTVTNIEEIRQPEIIFEDIATMQINGARYIRVPKDIIQETLINKMNKEALCGNVPEFINLTEDGKLKTGSKVTLNGEVEYIIAIEGDINCDGKVTFEDIIKANAVRISEKEQDISIEQLLASDINTTGKIEFRDIISINAIRINSIQ